MPIKKGFRANPGRQASPRDSPFSPGPTALALLGQFQKWEGKNDYCTAFLLQTWLQRSAGLTSFCQARPALPTYSCAILARSVVFPIYLLQLLNLRTAIERTKEHCQVSHEHTFICPR